MKNCNKDEKTLREYVWRVVIHCSVELDSWMTDYFGGFDLRCRKNGGSILAGELPDISAVYGLILQLRDFGIQPLSLCVKRICINDIS